jgi:hypothetical protein
VTGDAAIPRKYPSVRVSSPVNPAARSPIQFRQETQGAAHIRGYQFVALYVSTLFCILGFNATDRVSQKMTLKKL